MAAAACAGRLLFGLGIGLGSPHELAYRQAVTPDRLQGRMNATIRSLNWGMIAVAASIGGLLADLRIYRPGPVGRHCGGRRDCLRAAGSPFGEPRCRPKPPDIGQRSMAGGGGAARSGAGDCSDMVL